MASMMKSTRLDGDGAGSLDEGAPGGIGLETRQGAPVDIGAGRAIVSLAARRVGLGRFRRQLGHGRISPARPRRLRLLDETGGALEGGEADQQALDQFDELGGGCDVADKTAVDAGEAAAEAPKSGIQLPSDSGKHHQGRRRRTVRPQRRMRPR